MCYDYPKFSTVMFLGVLVREKGHSRVLDLAILPAWMAQAHHSEGVRLRQQV